MNIEAPPRAQWIRTILFELARIANVTLFLGDMGVQLGALTQRHAGDLVLILFFKRWDIGGGRANVFAQNLLQHPHTAIDRAGAIGK